MPHDLVFCACVAFSLLLAAPAAADIPPPPLPYGGGNLNAIIAGGLALAGALFIGVRLFINRERGRGGARLLWLGGLGACLIGAAAAWTVNERSVAENQARRAREQRESDKVKWQMYREARERAEASQRGKK